MLKSYFLETFKKVSQVALIYTTHSLTMVLTMVKIECICYSKYKKKKTKKNIVLEKFSYSFNT